ncbi:MAG: hypothetical protein ABF380_05960, partial [Akkermansiaceae bacterium]
SLLPKNTIFSPRVFFLLSGDLPTQALRLHRFKNFFINRRGLYPVIPVPTGSPMKSSSHKPATPSYPAYHHSEW